MNIRRAWWYSFPLMLVIACTGPSDTGDTTETDEPGVDADNDGYTADVDCDDTNPAINPGATEDDCTDPIDYNCDGETLYADEDSDGWAACEDCDDDAALVNPDADEECDGIDNDCDGDVDAEDDDVIDLQTYFADSDGDNFGDDGVAIDACSAPTGYVSDNSDCDDERDDVYPGATEVCDGTDNDCDLATDDDDDDVVGQGTWYLDDDEDELGDPAMSLLACDMPDGYVINDLDCNDGDPEVGEAPLWFEDRDKDTYGNAAVTRAACAQPTGYVSIDGDCDDRDDEINPDAVEICDEVDNDCDTDIDDDDGDVVGQSDWYPDDDEDDYGDEDASAVTACFAPTDHVADNTDCDDTTHLVHPGRFDFDDDQDNDCDTSVDEDVGSETYAHDSDIQSIWSSKCTGCHGSSGGLSLSSAYSTIVNGSSSLRGMDYIEPGDLRNSYLWHKLQGTQLTVGGKGGKMPASGSLTTAQLATIETWILEGAIK